MLERNFHTHTARCGHAAGSDEQYVENAIRGARNPMNSWKRMDSHTDENGNFVFGPNDLDLAVRLVTSGTDHRKFMRMMVMQSR